MVAYMASDRTTVDCAYQVAIENGGTPEVVTSLRPEYHENDYGVYLRVAVGNRLRAACYSPKG